MAVWIAAAVVIISIVTFATIVLVVQRNPQARVIDERIGHEMQRRRELTIASAKAEVEVALARNGKVTMWASAIPPDIAATLATLPVDVADMFRRHRRMTFPESYIDLAAEFLVEPTPGAVVPVGYVQIGLSHEHSEIVCTSRSSAEVVVSPFDADSPRDRFTSIYHFILCEAAFELERRNGSLDPPPVAAT